MNPFGCGGRRSEREGSARSQSSYSSTMFSVIKKAIGSFIITATLLLVYCILSTVPHMILDSKVALEPRLVA